MEKVDILLPPSFEKSGKIKTKEQAWKDEDWIGTFNLWVVQKNPEPSIVYQQRDLAKSWAPGKLDVSAGGHYNAGEEIYDGLREVREELGKNYDTKELIYLGRKMHVGFDVEGRKRHNLVEIFMIEDNSSLDSFILQKEEVYAICKCGVKDLIKAHTETGYTFIAKGLDNMGKKIEIEVNKDSFPYNWDNYHFKIALLAQRYLKGEDNLIY